jgi:hypothetical protein
MSDVSRDASPIPLDSAPVALQFILENAFRSGFGTLGKTELDLILFSALLQFGNQDSVSDYALSKYLQITQRRVRGLKERASVKYMKIEREHAIRVFVDRSAYARIDGVYLDVPLEEVAVKNEIEAILDENHGLVHYQINPKIFRVRIEDFLDLVAQLVSASETHRNPDDVLDEIVESLRQHAAEDDETRQRVEANVTSGPLSKENLKQTLISGGLKTVIGLVVNSLPGGPIFTTLVLPLLQNIASSI